MALLYNVISSLEKRMEPTPQGHGSTLTQNPIEEITYKGRRYIINDDISTLLIIGLDKFGQVYENNSYRNDQQADFILLMLFNDADKTCSFIHLNRDTMTEVTVLSIGGKEAGSVTEQLALAHTYGTALQDSCRNTQKAVSALLNNVPIDYYISVTMDAVSLLNDLVGGVKVTIEDDFTATDATLIQGQTITLQGEHALNYVRARSSMTDNTNIARMKRQKTYMSSFVEALRQAIEADDNFSLNAFEAISEYMVTDATVNILSDSIEKITNYELRSMVSPEGEAVLGERFIEFYADKDSIDQIVLEYFYTPQ